MRPPYRLVPDSLSHDTIEASQQLAEMAAAGQIVGIGVVVMLKGRNYWVNSAGECRRNPTWTRGMPRDLDDELGAMSRQHRSR